MNTTAQKHGMTFLEIVIAVALFSLILLGTSQILFTLTVAMGTVQTEPRHQVHPDGVTKFLETAFLECEMRTATRSEQPAWGSPPNQNFEALTFELPGGHPFFVTSQQPAPKSQAYLVFDRERGLELWWTFEEIVQQQPQRRGRGGRQRQPQLQRFTLSPYAVDLEYHYRQDEEEWIFVSATDDEAIRKDLPLVGLRLTYDVEGRHITRYVSLAPRLGRVLLY